MIKLLALDCDGTLLDKHGRVSEKNKQALQVLREHGILPVLVSGRIPLGMEELIRELNMEKTTHIAANGAMLYSLEEGVTLLSTFDKGEYLRFVEHLHQKGIEFFCFVENRLVYDNVTTFLDYMRKFIGTSPMDPGDTTALEGVYKMAAHFKTPRERRDIESFSSPLIAIRHSDPKSFDVAPIDASKGSALSALCKTLGIMPHEVAAVGDNGNDLPMLKWAGASFAVGNAVEDCKACVDHVLPYTNDEDAVFHLIYDYLLPQTEALPN